MNIIFDLGGVVVTWQPEAIIASVFPDPATQAKVRREIVEHPDWVAQDRGTLPLEEAIARGAKRTALSESEIACFFRQVPAALMAIPGTVALLYRLKARAHTLFCLSNMHPPFIEHLEMVYSFWEVFTGSAISCRLHLCKPEPGIYTHLLNAYGLDTGDTIVVDDVDANLLAAARLGLKTIRFESPEQCEMELRKLGCL